MLPTYQTTVPLPIYTPFICNNSGDIDFSLCKARVKCPVSALQGYFYGQSSTKNLFKSCQLDMKSKAPQFHGIDVRVTFTATKIGS